MRFARLLRFALWVGLSLSTGCSSGEKPADSGESAVAPGSVAAVSGDESKTDEPAADEVRKVPSTSLPATQGMSPPVDGGRLQVPMLPRWTVPPRTSEWLFRLQLDRKTAYPQILVTVDESYEPQVEKLNKTNVADFVSAWQKHLSKTHDTEAFGEPVSPVRIGKRYGTECLIHSVAGKMSLDQLMVSMIGAGRVYTLELRAQRGTLEDYRTDFYAVVAGTTIEMPMATPNELGPLKEFPEFPAEASSEDSAKAAPPVEADAK